MPGGPYTEAGALFTINMMTAVKNVFCLVAKVVPLVEFVIAKFAFI